jgi:beta-glucosidase
MDYVVDGADDVAAGNDVIMPGGPPVIEQILKGFDEGCVTREELETAVMNLFSVLRRFDRYHTV